MPGIKPHRDQQSVKEKQARKPRFKGFARQRAIPTHWVEHVLESCPECGTGLAGGWGQRTREVIDLPLVPVQVTEHVFIARTCPVCERRRIPRADLGGVVLGQQRLGVNLLSLIAAPAGKGTAALAHHPVVPEDGASVESQLGGNRGGGPPSGPKSPTDGDGDTRPNPSQPGGPRRRDRLAGGRGQRLRLDFQHPHRAVLPPPGSEQGGGGRGPGRFLRRGVGQRLLRRLPPLPRAEAAVLGPPAAGHPRPEGPLPPRPGTGPVGGGSPPNLPCRRDLRPSPDPATAGGSNNGWNGR